MQKIGFASRPGLVHHSQIDIKRCIVCHMSKSKKGLTPGSIVKSDETSIKKTPNQTAPFKAPPLSEQLIF